MKKVCSYPALQLSTPGHVSPVTAIIASACRGHNIYVLLPELTVMVNTILVLEQAVHDSQSRPTL